MHQMLPGEQESTPGAAASTTAIIIVIVIIIIAAGDDHDHDDDDDLHLHLHLHLRPPTLRSAHTITHTHTPCIASPDVARSHHVRTSKQTTKMRAPSPR